MAIDAQQGSTVNMAVGVSKITSCLTTCNSNLMWTAEHASAQQYTAQDERTAGVKSQAPWYPLSGHAALLTS
jgi:hypothetical protein